MHRHMFDILPYGDGWSVSSDGEPLIVTRNKSKAKALAKRAAEALTPVETQGRSIGEPRSFADKPASSGGRTPH